MSDSTQTAHNVSCTVDCQGCDEPHGRCCGHGEELHVHVHVHHHCCSSASVPAQVELPVIKFGYSGVAVGNPAFPNVMTQVYESSNYGRSGTYKKIRAVETSDATQDIVNPSFNAAQLKAKYAVLSVGLHLSLFTLADAVKLKDYAALGGVVILVCDHGLSAGMTNVLQGFGHVGPFVAVTGVGLYTGASSVTESLSNYFGNSFGVPLVGEARIVMTAAQLPAGSRVLATLGDHILFWLVGGTMGRVIAMSDINLTTFNVTGVAVDTDQEKFVNNMMAYVFDQALENA